MFHTTLDCNGRALALDEPRISGIVNVTPDSFSDGGRFIDAERAVEHARKLVDEGADLIDIGGESTRPGAVPISADTEIRRVVPVIEMLAREIGVPISIDTSKPAVMRAAIAAGAGLINDVRALREEGALDAAAALGVPVILVHMLGEPGTMQDDPHYDDVVGDVHRFLTERLFACQMAGIDKKKILVDPGFGFGKTLAHNMLLLRDLQRFAEIAPVVAGLSRKATIGTLTGRKDHAERAAGSAAAALIAVQNGAAIVRVHDVAITRDALAIWKGVVAQGAPPRRKAASAGIRWGDDD